MRIRVGYELIYECPQPTPMILMLNVHYSRVSDLESPDILMTDPALEVEAYRDGFGNWCNRLVAPGGRLLLATDHADYARWMLGHALRERRLQGHDVLRRLDEAVADVDLVARIDDAGELLQPGGLALDRAARLGVEDRAVEAEQHAVADIDLEIALAAGGGVADAGAVAEPAAGTGAEEIGARGRRAGSAGGSGTACAGGTAGGVGELVL